MRLLALLPLAVATVVEASRGNTFAIGIALATIAPLAFFAAAALVGRVAAAPRKADPAKIARMERELGFEPPLQGPREWVFTETGDIRPADERPTTVLHRPPDPTPGVENIARPATAEQALYQHLKPTAERDCPRPEACVMAHPCRKCGADRGEACVGDTARLPMVRYEGTMREAIEIRRAMYGRKRP